ncbi:hypothetical protein VIBNISO65_1270032 [Vibrio nigripulchritudo SO65]|nr:hypothetical protein VIBNIAM115_200013 [Vibrio nigripulchritudo AM115]CCN44198.1 hypothetical protein VIBNIFTn2_720013 [Vibrio nigripulchritudo FTn2]CCN75077.1 hypothetical protein VIBNISO65_1270032 [Vibrio nigripulchritudo SO65]
MHIILIHQLDDMNQLWQSILTGRKDHNYLRVNKRTTYESCLH